MFADMNDIIMIVGLIAWCGVGYMMVLPYLYHDKRRRKEAELEVKHIARFSCVACHECGESRSQPEFDCLACDGTGIRVYPFDGDTAYFLANMTESMKQRFIGFQEVI